MGLKHPLSHVFHSRPLPYPFPFFPIFPLILPLPTTAHIYVCPFHLFKFSISWVYSFIPPRFHDRHPVSDPYSTRYCYVSSGTIVAVKTVPGSSVVAARSRHCLPNESQSTLCHRRSQVSIILFLCPTECKRQYRHDTIAVDVSTLLILPSVKLKKGGIKVEARYPIPVSLIISYRLQNFKIYQENVARMKSLCNLLYYSWNIWGHSW